MKKLLSLLPILVLLSFSTSAQVTKLVSTYNQVGIYNKYLEKYDWNPHNYATITIYFGKQMIWMDNISESQFRITGRRGENTGVNNDGISWKDFTWIAIDNKGRRCDVSLTKFNDNTLMFVILYDDLCFRYFANSSGLDNF